MAFCKFSTQVVQNKQTSIDNVFIQEFLPTAPESAVKVFVYGLYACNFTQEENSIERFSKVLGLSEDDIYSIFLYWQDNGLIQILNTHPFEVRYMPIKTALGKPKNWSEDKYKDFNIQISEVLCGRMLTPNEFNEFYIVIETYKMQPEALVGIAKYCADLKGNNVGHAYITTVAKAWATEGVRTYEKVKEKIQACAEIAIQANQMLSALGTKRSSYIEEQHLLIKWIEDFGFEFDSLLKICKLLKKKHVNRFEKLDERLIGYYSSKIFSFEEIEEFEKSKDKILALSKEITRSLGIYYDSHESAISTFVLPWVNLGFEDKTLLEISNHCFKKSVRSLEGMNEVVLKFHKKGLLTTKAIHSSLDEIAKQDVFILEVLQKMGIERHVNSWDRSQIKCWQENWNFDNDLILFAGELACGKSNAIQYANKILSDWLAKNIKTIDEAKKISLDFSSSLSNNNSGKKNVVKPKGREYTTTEINALFDDLDEIEI